MTRARLFIGALVALCAAAIVVPVALATPSSSTQVAVEHLLVQPGDSWSTIALRLDPTLSGQRLQDAATSLAVANGNDVRTVLIPGRILVYIPGSAATVTLPPTTATTPAEAAPTTDPDSAPATNPTAVDVAAHLTSGHPLPSSSASEPSGSFRIICGVSHLNWDDPIVYPGQPGASHLHQYFGNDDTDASSSYASLRAAGDGSCQGGAANRTGYWIPAMLNGSGQVVEPTYISTYYKCNGFNAARCKQFEELPAGLKMLAGWTSSNPTGGLGPHARWSCEGQPAQSSIPATCTGSQQLEATIEFPSCWDGLNLDSADHRSHMAFAGYGDGSGQFKCPSTHPHMLPQITYNVFYLVPNATGAKFGWHLASDMANPGGLPGSTLHGDWFGAWDPSIQTEWFTNCIIGLRNCGGGELGDGRQLSGPRNDSRQSVVVASPEMPAMNMSSAHEPAAGE